MEYSDIKSTFLRLLREELHTLSSHTHCTTRGQTSTASPPLTLPPPPAPVQQRRRLMLRKPSSAGLAGLGAAEPEAPRSLQIEEEQARLERLKPPSGEKPRRALAVDVE